MMIHFLLGLTLINVVLFEMNKEKNIRLLFLFNMIFAACSFGVSLGKTL